jgi:hypothetical protein
MGFIHKRNIFLSRLWFGLSGVRNPGTARHFYIPQNFRTNSVVHPVSRSIGRLRLKCDGTRSETRVLLSAKRRVLLNRRGRQFSRLLAAEVCASAVVMLDTPRSEVVWRVLAAHSIRQFRLHFPSRASPCAITFQLDSTGVHSRGQSGCSMKLTAYRHLTYLLHGAESFLRS